MKAKVGDWVRIKDLVLRAEDRSENLPEDTKKLPLEMWTKGFLLNDQADFGDQVEVETYIGRKVRGQLVEINPSWDHDFGQIIPEILYIGRQARDLLEKAGEEDEE